MLTARRCLKSPQSLSCTSAHPTMVTLVNIMVMNGWLTSFSFYVNWPSHSRDKAITDYDLEISTPGSRSWVWSKDKVIQSAQYHIKSLRFHFTSIRSTIPEIELFRNLTLKHPRSRSWVRSKVKVTYCTQYPTHAFPFRFISCLVLIQGQAIYLNGWRYRQVSNIRRTKSQHFKEILVLYCDCLCRIPWSQTLSREWRCSWSSADRRCSNYIWVIGNFIAY